MAFTAYFVFQQELRTEIHLFSSAILLLGCSSYFPLTDKIQIQSHGNTVLRDQKEQTSEWVSATGIALVPLSLISWHSSTAAPSCGRVVSSVPQLLWQGQSCLCCSFARSVPACCRVAKGPSSGKCCSYSAAVWELLGCRPELHAQGWENSLLIGVGLGGLGCFSGN